MWVFPDISQLDKFIPSSECWDCEENDDDVFEMPMFTPTNNVESKTTDDQLKTEHACGSKIKLWLRKNDLLASTALNRQKCLQYLMRGIKTLSSSYSNLDCSRTWICYWIINSLNLLNADAYYQSDIKHLISFIKSSQHIKGGFGGGPYQFAHMAATFGAILALLSIGTKEAYDAIDRNKFYDFLMRMKQFDGSFSVQDGGEIDIRAAYCGLSCASILNILDEKLCLNTLNWLSECQTYQGGFGQEPHDEAHGGYAYCGMGCYIIISSHFPHLVNNDNKIDVNRLIRWQCMKQMEYSGGFQGRTHKLVDACYSFWVGAVFPMINQYKMLEKKRNKLLNKNNVNDNVDNKDNDNDNNVDNTTDGNDDGFVSLFHTLQLQKYVLICCQYHTGGISDKPPKPSDYYHTCYGLSGLSVAQHYDNKLFGPTTNKLVAIDPVYGLVEDKLIDAWSYFRVDPIVVNNDIDDNDNANNIDNDNNDNDNITNNDQPDKS